MSTGQYVLALLLFILGFACAVMMVRKFPQIFCNILLFLISVGSLVLLGIVVRNPNIFLVWKYVASVVDGCIVFVISVVHDYIDDYLAAVRKLNKILEE